MIPLEILEPAQPGMLELFILLGAVATAIGAIWKFIVRPIAAATKNVHRTYEKVMEYDGRLAHVERRSEELVNNSGSSLRDAVDRIEFKQAGQTKMFNEHLDWAQAEILKVWQNLASRDAVEAAKKTAEILEATERGNDDGSLP